MGKTLKNNETAQLGIGAVSGSLFTYHALMYNCIGMRSTWIEIKGEHMEDAINRFYRNHPTCELLDVKDCH